MDCGDGAAEMVAPVVEALLRDCDSFLFDCDGTLYRGGQLLPHVAEAIQHLRDLGKAVFFVTNTSSRSREQLRDKLVGLGVTCSAEECVPSCVFAADYIRRKHPLAERTYVTGGQGVIDELARVGIAGVGGPVENDMAFSEAGLEVLAEGVAAEPFDGVVVGWDSGLSYHKIAKSSLVFQAHPDAFFYATNDDAADRVGRWLIPGNGPSLQAVEAACAACAPARCGREKPFGAKAQVLGKPNPDYARLIAEWHNLDLRRAVMVGDRLDTDTLMGLRAGMRTLHVLSGVDDMEQVQAKGIRPDFVLPGVGCFWDARPR